MNPRQLYYEENNIRTQVNEYGFANQEGILYNHAVGKNGTSHGGNRQGECTKHGGGEAEKITIG